MGKMPFKSDMPVPGTSLPGPGLKPIQPRQIPSRKKISSRQDIMKTLQKGINKQREGKLEEAEFFYQLVLRDNPKQADALNLMGALAAEGKLFDISADFLEKAVKLRPNDPIFLNNLANTYILMEEPRLAVPLLKKALKISNAYFEASLNLARAQAAMGLAEQSLDGYRKALEKKPGHMGARTGLARSLTSAGYMDEAIAEYKNILSDDPKSSAAYYGLASSRKFSPEDREPLAIENVLSSDDLGIDEREYLHHAAGKMYNDMGQYDDAFRHFDAAKKLAGSKFDLEKFRGEVTSYIDLFTPEFFKRRSGFGDRDARPVFIVGMPRSGTTLTEQILSSHPDVFGAGELTDMHRISKPLLQQLHEEKRGGKKTLKAADIRASAKQYLSEISKMSGPALRVTDKMPHNFMYLGLISLLFPNARIIHCQRDPMDNCVSCFTNKFNQVHGYNTSLAVLGQYYQEYRRLMAHWESVLPAKMLSVQYEDTVDDLETSARRLVDFAELPWDNACLRFFESQRDVNTLSVWQVRQPIYKTSKQRWRNYENHLTDLKKGLGKYYRNTNVS